MEIENGGENKIKPADVNCRGDDFENAIRKIGVVFACEWFGYDADSDFREETIKVLLERSEKNSN